MSNKVNFLPEDYLDKKAQRRTNAVCLFLFILVVGGVGGAFVVTEQRQKAVKEKAAEINRQMTQAGKALGQLELLEYKKKQMETKASISAMLMEPVPRSLLLAIITNALPADVSLTEYNLASKEVIDQSSQSQSKKDSRNKKEKIAEVTETVVAKKWNTTIKFGGIAPTDEKVSQFMANLNESVLFNQVNLLVTEEYQFPNEDELTRRFELQVVLAPEARADKMDVESARRKHIRGM